MIPKGPTVLLILDDYGVVDETEHTGRHIGDDGSPDEGMSLCDGQSTAVWDCAVPGFMVCSRVCFKMQANPLEIASYHVLEKNIDNADKRAKAVTHLHGAALAAAILAKKRGENAELATMQSCARSSGCQNDSMEMLP